MDAWIRFLYMYIIILRSFLIHLSDCSQTGYGHKIVIIQTRLFESFNNFSSPGPWSASLINCCSRDHTLSSLKCLDKVVTIVFVSKPPPPSSYYQHHFADNLINTCIVTVDSTDKHSYCQYVQDLFL